MSEVSTTVNCSKITLLRGDITRQQVDAIVNAANPGLRGGGGVDGAIHRAGGPSILEECNEIRKQQGTCAPGNAVITGGGNLKSRHVIHAVGPIWRGGTANEAQTLAGAYKKSLNIACECGLKTVAFPSISTGAYGYPVDAAAGIAVQAVREFCEENSSLSEVRFVLFDEFTYNAYRRALEQS